MKEEKEIKLEGRTVRIYGKSGYNVTGILKFIDAEKLIIEQGEAVFLIYKTEVAMVLLNADKFSEPELENPIQPEYNIEDTPTAEVSPFAENGVVGKNQYGSILPSTLLEQQPDLPPEENYEDFSVSAGMFNNEQALLGRAERKKMDKYGPGR